MNTKILKSFYVILLGFGLILMGCESNDNPQNSIYIPKPVNRKVLVEFFTNSGCTPCVAAHNYLDQITASLGVTLNDTSVVIISYHVKYPFIQDSLYNANTTQNDARSTFYSIYYTPQCRLDGTNMGQFSSSSWSARINTEFNTTKYLTITLSNTFNSGTDSGQVTASILPVTSLPDNNNNVIHVIITESKIPYITAPNGIKSFDDVMRYMVTGQDGEAVSLSTGQTTEITKAYGVQGTWTADNCHLVVFVQNTQSKQIYGVERIMVK